MWTCQCLLLRRSSSDTTRSFDLDSELLEAFGLGEEHPVLQSFDCTQGFSSLASMWHSKLKLAKACSSIFQWPKATGGRAGLSKRSITAALTSRSDLSELMSFWSQAQGVPWCSPWPLVAAHDQDRLGWPGHREDLRLRCGL